MFLYASFNRPLWIGFDPGVWFKIIDKESKDMINGRMPHEVIFTNEPISPEKIKDLELTDYQEVAEKNKLYAYAATKFKPSSYLNCVNALIHKKTITTPEEIDNYASKVKGGV